MTKLSELLYPSEKIGLKWILRNTKYTKNDIKYNINTSPDFICNDGTKYEIKTMNENQLYFSSTTQMKEMEDTLIIVVDVEKEEVVKTFYFDDLKNMPKLKTYHSGKKLVKTSIYNKSKKESHYHVLKEYFDN